MSLMVTVEPRASLRLHNPVLKSVPSAGTSPRANTMGPSVAMDVRDSSGGAYDVTTYMPAA